MQQLSKTVAGNGSQQSQCLGTDLSLTPLPYISPLQTSSLHSVVAILALCDFQNPKQLHLDRKRVYEFAMYLFFEELQCTAIIAQLYW